ncbi:Cytochrome P450 [Popillia japonica]|uniref:Cytochrome P450 n=1 Tax=Popillia japonica TaxID=7064 RepID=A0AAW1N3G6_POPJA
MMILHLFRSEKIALTDIFKKGFYSYIRRKEIKAFIHILEERKLFIYFVDFLIKFKDESNLEERKSLNYYRGDFVDFLIKFKDESNLGDSEIVALATQFLLAGYESSNTTISLALYELALNKCIQTKLREEILSNLDAEGDISYDSVNTMEYLDKIVHETLRKYPVFPAIGRTCTKDYKIPNSAVVIEKGVTVIISLSGMHHDPKYFPDPEVFDPERFTTENVRRRPPYTFLPFGEGQRSCIGQRLGLLLVKLGLAYVIRSFEVDVCDETVVPLQFSPKKINLCVEGDKNAPNTKPFQNKCSDTKLKHLENGLQFFNKLKISNS